MLAEHKRTNEKVAIKFLKGALGNTADGINKIYRESKMLSHLNHKNIIQLKAAFPMVEKRTMVMVMEYASGGELRTLISRRKRLQEDEARYIFHQLCNAVSYCHKYKIIHRDLKPENIIFESPESYKIKVVDFGISGLVSNTDKDRSNAGSLKYMAPEVLSFKKNEADPAVDIWSMGCILFTMVTGHSPFRDKDKEKTRERIINCEYSFPDHTPLSNSVKDLISKILI